VAEEAKFLHGDLMHAFTIVLFDFLIILLIGLISGLFTIVYLRCGKGRSATVIVGVEDSSLVHELWKSAVIVILAVSTPVLVATLILFIYRLNGEDIFDLKLFLILVASLVLSTGSANYLDL
jgi:hypothetical protein